MGDRYDVGKDAMLQYFLSKIDVRLKSFEAAGLVDGNQEVAAEILSLRKALGGEKADAAAWDEDNAWTQAYRLERLMALIEPSELLPAEIRRRLEEAANTNVTIVGNLRTTADAALLRALDTSNDPPTIRPAEVNSLRLLLLGILEEIHWTNRRTFYARPLLQKATFRLVFVGIIASVFFLLPYLIFYLWALFTDAVPTVYWGILAFWTALTAGLFGAVFSRLLYLQNNGPKISLQELERATSYGSITLRGCVGLCGALIVFFFLQSGYVTGALFPDMKQLNLLPPSPTHAKTEAGQKTAKDSGDGDGSVRTDVASATIPEEPVQAGQAPPTPGTAKPASETGNSAQAGWPLVMPSQALALLAIWCFLAGWSERMVPSILSSTERRLTDAAIKT